VIQAARDGIPGVAWCAVRVLYPLYFGFIQISPPYGKNGV